MRIADHFSFFWQTQGVHEYFNYARLLDKQYLTLLQELRAQSILENTLVLFMADHGVRLSSFRRTYQGMLEESMPFLIALYPEWLEEVYPLAMSNLKNNSHSLVTAYDLHATLKDMTNLDLLRSSNIQHRTEVLQSLGKNIPRGISLFLPIPGIRNCELAGIPSHFCVCHELQQLSASDEISQTAARFTVESINMLIKDHKLCQTLRLDAVLKAFKVKKDPKQKEFEVVVELQTLPGEGLFEATIMFSGDSLALGGDITRANKYGEQAYCVHDFRIEMYCYCL